MDRAARHEQPLSSTAAWMGVPGHSSAHSLTPSPSRSSCPQEQPSESTLWPPRCVRAGVRRHREHRRDRCPRTDRRQVDQCSWAPRCLCRCFRCKCRSCRRHRRHSRHRPGRPGRCRPSRRTVFPDTAQPEDSRCPTRRPRPRYRRDHRRSPRPGGIQCTDRASHRRSIRRGTEVPLTGRCGTPCKLSNPLQNKPSSQSASSAQSVHRSLDSSQAALEGQGGVPGWQTPDAAHVSVPLQNTPSSQSASSVQSMHWSLDSSQVTLAGARKRARLAHAGPPCRSLSRCRTARRHRNCRLTHKTHSSGKESPLVSWLVPAAKSHSSGVPLALQSSLAPLAMSQSSATPV